MTRNPVSAAAADWRGDDWESARRRKFTLGLAATPSQRLAWLEEAIRLAWAVGALPRPRQHVVLPPAR